MNHAHSTPPPSSWPFPAAGHFRRQAATSNHGAKPDSSADEDDPPHPDPVEQELVDEQLERDRKAARAVDSKIGERGNPQ